MSQFDLQEALEIIDPEAYLDREGIDYKRTHGASGEQLNIRECPFCGGGERKVYMNAESGLGNCFHGSCGSRFNLYTFIRSHTGLNDSQTIQHIREVAREMGWRARRVTAVDVEEAEVSEITLPQSVALPLSDGRNLKYLDNRRIDGDLARYFRLRYSADGAYFYRHGSEVKYQEYKKRIIIPIYSGEGKLVGFQGRDITGKAEQKYLFPPGVASKGKFLFNAHNAIRTTRAVICEGVFDVMSVKSSMDMEPELRDVLAMGTFGISLSHGHGDGQDQLTELRKLKAKGLREVVFMWDSEPNAIAEACRAALLTNGIGLASRIALLPPGKDPNEASPTEVREAFYKALPATRANITKLRIKHPVKRAKEAIL